MVLLVLAIVWGVLLVSWFRSRSNQGAFSDSVGTFRRHLTVLERAAPVRVAPANRLRGGTTYGIPAYRPQGARRAPTNRPGFAGSPRPGSPAAMAALRRRQAQKRRRDVLLALIAGVVATLLLAAVARTSAIWVLQAAFDLVLAGYVALLVRMRNLAAERQLKLRYMSREQVRAGRERPAYELDAGSYADLSLRRAAN